MPRKGKHANIPVFIPHMGCPHTCVFCDQRTISGHRGFDPDSARDTVEGVLATLSPDTRAEIAFFGGSFTGIDRGLMCRLLDIAQSYVDAGRVSGIRLSTRPDYIDDAVLTILSRYTVCAVELGIQSLDDTVLTLSQRGHDSAAAEAACRAVVRAGFPLVGQMMIGLPGATGESETETARGIVSLGAAAARVYPTVVFRGTELGNMLLRGEYKALSERETVVRTADVLDVFAQADIPVLRVGLCASEQLSDADAVLGGASQAAIGEMAMGEIYYRRMAALLLSSGAESFGHRHVRFLVPRGATSKALGQRRCNAHRLCEVFGLAGVRVTEADGLPDYTVKLLDC